MTVARQSSAPVGAIDAWSRVFQALGVGALVTTLVASAALTASAGLDLARTSYLIANILLYVFITLNSRRGGVSIIIGFFFLFFVAVPANLQIQLNSFPFQSTYVADALAHGYTILAAAQLSYILGELIVDVRTPLASFSDSSAARAVTPLQPITYWRAVAFISVSSLAIAAIVGPSRLFITREQRSIEFVENSEGVWQQLLFVGRSISLLGAVICVYLLRRDRESRTPRRIALTAVMLVAFLALNYPPGLARFQLLGATLAILAVMTSFFRRPWKILFASVAPLFLFYLFPAIKALGYGNGVNIAASIDRDVQEYLVRVDFDGFKQIVDTWLYTQTNPLRWGENFLGVVFFWVPRSIWAGKPVDSGEIVSTSLGYPYNNVSNPLPSEAYISFGMIGVVLIFVALGAVVSRVENTSRARAAFPSGHAHALLQSDILLALLMGYGVIILRGSLNGVAPMFLSGFALFALIMYANRRRARRESRPVGRGLSIHVA